MIIITIIIGVTALLAGHAAGLTETKIGTAAITAIILLLAISALPECYWLFDSAAGWLTTLIIWLTTSHYYHRLFADLRRSTPVVNRSTPIGRRRSSVVGRRLIVWQFGRQRLAFAWSTI